MAKKLLNLLNKLKYVILIIAVAMLVSIPLLSKNLDVYYDDGVQHICRAYSTYLSMKNGENTTVLSNLANGYGYSWNLFYGPLSVVAMLICKLVTTSFVNSYKLVLFLGLLLSRNNNVSFCEKISRQ